MSVRAHRDRRAVRRASAPVAAVTLCSYLLALAPRTAQASEEHEAPSVASVVDHSAKAVHEAAALPVAANALEVSSPITAAAPSVSLTAAEPAQSTSPIPNGLAKAGSGTQAISLPTGAATIQGMGESFSTQLSTGVASFSVPIATVGGRGGVSSSLALVYSSGAGYGVAGMGWGITIPAISRHLDRGTPGYHDPAPAASWHAEQDRFVWAGSEDLVPICQVGDELTCAGAPAEVMPAWAAHWQYFRAHIETSFLRFFWSPDHRTWRIQDKNGGQMELGVPLDGSGYDGALETDPKDARSVFQWNIVRQYDQHVDPETGAPVDLVVYRYLHSGAMAYLSDVYGVPPRTSPSTAPLSQYAQHVHLEYEPRTDRLVGYRRGWEVRTDLRLSKITNTSKTFSGGPNASRELVRRVLLSYDTKYHQSFLTSVQAEGRCPWPITEEDLLRGPSFCPRLPAMTFDYVHASGHDTAGGPATATLPGYEPFDERLVRMKESPPHSLNDPLVTLWDVDANGLPDVLVTSPGLFKGGHGLFLNGAFGQANTFATSTTMGVVSPEDADGNVLKLTNPSVSPQDLDGDGVVDLLHMPPIRDYAVYTPQRSAGRWNWVGRKITNASLQQPKIDFSKGAFNTQVMDVNGDGLVDVVFSSATEIQTFFALGRYPGGDGQFGQARWTGPTTASISNEPARACVPWSASAVRLGDPDARIADMNGDGLPDIVRVRHGDVRYWPGRGNGAWGTGSRSDCDAGTFAEGRHIAMAEGPEFGVTEGSSLLLSDINGDGLADLVKIRFDAVDIWINVDGLAWTERHIIVDTPANPSSRDHVRLVDINGSGTPDILWGEASNYQYIDLQGGARPGVISRIDNGLGKSTEIEYVDSTKAMLAAAKDGKPWSSAMPVVSHLVARVTVRDNLEKIGLPAGAYVTEYGYRDPAYDGRHREFRGFRQAESRTIGDANSPTAISRSSFLLGECKDEAALDGVDICAPSQRWRDHGRDALKGLPTVFEQLDSSGTYLQTAHTTYTLRRLYVGLDGREVRHVHSSGTDRYSYDTAPFVAESSTVQLDDVLLEIEPGNIQTDILSSVFLASSAGRAHVQGLVEVDRFGNQTLGVAKGCIDGCTTADETILTHTVPYRPDGDASGWLFRTKESWITGSVRPGEIRDHARFEHDASGSLTRESVELLGTEPLERFHETPGAQGAHPTGASVDGWIEAGVYAHDVFGNIIDFRGAGHRCESTVYDADYAQLVTQATWTMGALVAETGCGAVSLVTSGSYDRGFGVAVDRYGTHGERSHVDLDGFGRVIAVWEPSPSVLGALSSLPSEQFEYQLAFTGRPYSAVFHKAQDGPTPDDDSYYQTSTFVDGLGRTVAAFREADPEQDGALWIGSKPNDYDAKGTVRRAYVPFYTDDPSVGVAPEVAYSSRRYDAFGRVIETRALDQTVDARFGYHALSQDRMDAADIGPGVHQGTYATERTDGHGRIVDRVERIRVAGVLEEHHTLTEYLPTGEVKRITRRRAAEGAADADIVRWARYDSLGRRILNVEPNSTKNFYADPDAAPPAGFHAWRYAYNDAGALVGASDARGCGVNYFYDTGGRRTGEDDSPCLNSQPAYSPPDFTPGAETGLEVLYHYDTPDPAAPSVTDAAGRTCNPNASTTAGRLTSMSDESSRTVFRFDGRGRTTCTGKQIAKPSGAVAIAQRYAPRWYVSASTFDADDRTVESTTGASTPGLLGPNGASALSWTYSARGSVKAVGSSYGGLVTSVERDASGLTKQIAYGDAASTKRAFAYDARQRLSSAQTFRGTPALWGAPSSSYFPPSPSEPPTRQLLLEDSDYFYDDVDNITEIHDFRQDAEWPAGGKPVTRRFSYDDLYRLASVDYEYAGGTDTWTSPLAIEHASSDSRPPPSPEVTFSSRVLHQTYAYDWLGNTAQTNDDAAAFYDRSLGQVTNGPANAGPYQLKTASNRSPLGGGTARAGDLDTRYDAVGNLTDLVIRRDGPCLPAGASCWQRFRYDWDARGRLSAARRWDLSAGDPNERSAWGDLAVAPPSRSTRAPDAELRFAYDATNERVRKTALDDAGQESHTLYVFSALELRGSSWSAGDYALDSQIETVYLRAGLVSARVVMALQDVPSQTSGHQRVFLEIGDHLGSSSMVIDRETGELVERSTYEAYGATESDYRTPRWNHFREAYQFTGKESDIEVGLVYFGQRYYAPSLNRWISADPATVHGLEDDLNVYAYVHGSVVNAVDPNGEFIVALWAAAAIAGAVLGGVSSGISFAARGGNLLSWQALGAIGMGAVSGAVGGFTAAVVPGGPLLAAMAAGGASNLVSYGLGVGTGGHDVHFDLGDAGAALGYGMAAGALAVGADAVTGGAVSKALTKGMQKAFGAIGGEIAGIGAAGVPGPGKGGPPGIGTPGPAAENPGVGSPAPSPKAAPTQTPPPQRVPGPGRGGASPQLQKVLQAQQAYAETHPGAGRPLGDSSPTEGAPKATVPYSRPSGATTPAQRASVQGKPCVDCGAVTPKQVADHKTPLVKEHYESGTIDKSRMRSLDAVQPQCPTCSARQGAEMSRYSREQRRLLGGD